MSVSFMWEIIKPDRAACFARGTSSDIEPLKKTFDGEIGASDLRTLRAMHDATHLKESLWAEIADTIETLTGDNPELKIKVWTEF